MIALRDIIIIYFLKNVHLLGLNAFYKLYEKYKNVVYLHGEKDILLMWCISMYHVAGLKQTRGIKNVTLKAAKKIVGVAVY